MSEKRKHTANEDLELPARKKAVKHVYGRKFFGPYLSERQWGTVREETLGNCWDSTSYDKISPGSYRWGEDGMFGFSDEEQKLCMALSLWNKKDSIVKERLFGLTGPQGNHGEDVKELYYYLDSDPDHTYMAALYIYPQREFPYKELLEKNKERTQEEPEYELLDTGVFDGNHQYWDIHVKYAKPENGVVLCGYNITNHSAKTTTLDVIPRFWFRNYYGRGENIDIPYFQLTDDDDTVTLYYDLGQFSVKFLESDLGSIPEICLTGNSSSCKTRCNVTYHLRIPPGSQDIVEWQLSPFKSSTACNTYNVNHIMKELKLNGEKFYEDSLYHPDWSEAEKQIAKGAWVGLLWNKQFYYYDVEEWYNKGQAKKGKDLDKPGNWDISERNLNWRNHFKACDILSVPDKWEFPWFASWDTCFQMIPFCRLDEAFAKNQLLLLLSERYMSPEGQIPGCEFNFDDNNPPIHAWTCLKVFRMTGGTDISFLRKCYNKLQINYKWWMTNLQCDDRCTFNGGFLGLDNISVIDRGSPPDGYTIKQVDATTWMAFFALSMFEMIIEITQNDQTSQKEMEIDAAKYLEDFLNISEQLNKNVSDGGFWNPEMKFYNDVLVQKSTNKYIPIEVKSLVGLLPLVACGNICSSNVKWSASLSQSLQSKPLHVYTDPVEEGSYFLTCVPLERLEYILNILFDEEEFLSAFGVRSLSKIHTKEYKLTLPIKQKRTVIVDTDTCIQNPTFMNKSDKSVPMPSSSVGKSKYVPFNKKDSVIQHTKELHTSRGKQSKGDKSFETDFMVLTDFSLHYTPGESDSGMMGGNSNWRGPIWMCANYIIIDALEKIHVGFGDRLKVEYPSYQCTVNLDIAKQDVCKRLVSVFLPDTNGARPLHGRYKQYTKHFWKDLILYYEYFHADTGRGCGASHQTGWTALITEILYNLYQ